MNQKARLERLTQSEEMNTKLKKDQLPHLPGKEKSQWKKEIQKIEAEINNTKEKIPQNSHQGGISIKINQKIFYIGQFKNLIIEI